MALKTVLLLLLDKYERPLSLSIYCFAVLITYDTVEIVVGDCFTCLIHWQARVDIPRLSSFDICLYIFTNVTS